MKYLYFAIIVAACSPVFSQEKPQMKDSVQWKLPPVEQNKYFENNFVAQPPRNIEYYILKKKPSAIYDRMPNVAVPDLPFKWHEYQMKKSEGSKNK